MNRLWRVVVGLWISACIAAAPIPPALENAAIVERDVMVSMRDGVRLATDVARPRGDGKHPVILTRTPYLKNFGGAAEQVKNGYAVLVQDVRGRFGSEGEFYPFKHEIDDAFDTIQWIAQQPWCDGHVGMAGGSYLGLTQLAAALSRPPALKCILPIVPPADFDNGTLFFEGNLRMELAQGWLLGQSVVSQRVLRKQVPAEELARWKGQTDFRKWGWHLPLSDPGPISLGGGSYARTWRDIVGAWEKPQAWQSVSAARRPQDIQVPVLIVAGFYDIFAQEDIELLLALRKSGGSDLARMHSHLLIGPWTHGVGGTTGDVSFASAKAALNGLQEKWFDRWLKGRQSDVDRWPVIHAFVMGQDRWIDTETWPPVQSIATKLYLSQGALSREAPAKDAAPATYTYDPQNPVTTLGGNNLMIPAGIRDHRKNADRTDVLAFVGAPLERDLTIVGPLKAHLFVSTDGPDTDFTAMLLDVRPDGYRANVQDGVARLRYRDGRDRPKLLQPNQVVEVDVNLWSTAWTFRAGHRIAVHIGSSNFMRFDRNLNSADPPATWTAARKAQNAVYRDAARASYIELPVLP